MAYKYDINKVTAKASGSWPAILRDLVPNNDLQSALDSGPRIEGPCPMCGGSTRFRLDDRKGNGDWLCNPRGGGCGSGDGMKLVMECNKITFLEALELVAEWLDIPANLQKAKEFKRSNTKRSINSDKPSKKNLAKMNSIWKQAIAGSDPAATALRRYLVQRGLGGFRDIPPVIKLHHGLEYWQAKPGTQDEYECLGKFPCMLAMVLGADGKPVTIHRTYLDPMGGKANVPKAKKVMSGLGDSCGAIRIDTPSHVLALTEGIETAIAVRLATGLPVWACLNAGELQKVRIPTRVKTVHIFADLDRLNPVTGYRPGTHSAEVLADRLSGEGRMVSIHVPPGPIPEGSKGVDWADIWVSHSNGDLRARDAFISLPVPVEIIQSAG